MHPAGHEGGIHPGPGNGAVRDGQQISSRRLQPLCASQIVGQVSILGGIQLNGDHLFACVQLAQERVIFFHRRCFRGGNLHRRGRFFHSRQRIQRCPQGGNVSRSGAAATSQDSNPFRRNSGQLFGEVFRLALILYLGAGDHRVARIGHDRQRQGRSAQLLYQCPHGTRGRNTVEAHRVHNAALRHPADQIFAVHALPGVAIRQHRKGDQHKGIRHLRLDGLHSLQHTGVRAQGLKQEVLCPLLHKTAGHCRVDASRRGSLGIRSRAQVRKNGRSRHHRRVHLGRRQALGVRGGAKVGKHGGVRPGRCLCRQLPACTGQRLPVRLLCRRHPGQAKRIGLDGLRAGCQVLPVDFPHARRVQQVALLTLRTGLGFIIGTHAAIKQKRFPGQMCTHVDHVWVSFIFFLDCIKKF